MELEKVKKKLNELDQQFTKLLINQGAYFMALLAILKEQGLLKNGRFQKLADQYKKQLKNVDEYADFLKMMRKFGDKK
ncbi:MAG: hypothetical protein ABH891_01020 [Candidatus Omnitrophota bacterium]